MYKFTLALFLVALVRCSRGSVSLEQQKNDDMLHVLNIFNFIFIGLKMQIIPENAHMKVLLITII